jgi:hypothetical protein
VPPGFRAERRGAWDLASSPRFAFVPIAVSALPLLLLPAAVRFQRAPQYRQL